MAKKKVTVYSKPNCVQCTGVKRWLDENGYLDQYENADAIEHVDALKAVLGVAQAPVVKIVDEATAETIVFTGFNRDLLIKHLAVAA